MNDLCSDVGFKSVNHFGEQLCGDHIEIVNKDNSSVIVLADGLGSGVKASILSTLTSKIISTMLSQGLSIEDCVKTVVDTLPVCSTRGVAYSTFTVLRLINNKQVEIVQYDNPKVIMLRDGKIFDYPVTEITISGKLILKSVVNLCENDIFILMSDGCPHAGIGNSMNFGWKTEEIGLFMESIAHVGYTAKTLATILVDECNKLYDYKPGDDTTACVVRIRRRVPINLLFGPPFNRDDCERMMSLFFSKDGKHIVCGGTTANIVANFLKKPLTTDLKHSTGDLPPIGKIEGVDLVTEGVITVNKVVSYAKNYLENNECYNEWAFGKDGASKICRMIFEDATDIDFYVGTAVNPAHQNPNLPINFNIKMNLVKELSQYLIQMGKKIRVSYF